MKTYNDSWQLTDGRNVYTLPNAISHLRNLYEHEQQLANQQTKRVGKLFSAIVFPTGIALTIWRNGTDYPLSQLILSVIGLAVFSWLVGVVLSVITEDILPTSFLRPQRFLEAEREHNRFKVKLMDSIRDYLATEYDAHARDEVIESIAEGSHGWFIITKEDCSYRCTVHRNGDDLSFMRMVKVNESEISL